MTAMLLPTAFLLALALPAGALAARSDWSAADQAQLRLLLSTPSGGRIPGGIEIALEPGWHTYWRNPGEAGVPPVFDFSGSENVADVEVLYPAPERYDDGTSVSLIYRDGVVFPLAVTPVEAGQPVTLQVRASFGVCREVCIPTRASSALTLPPAPQPDILAETLLKRYRPLVPGAPEPGRFDVESVTLDGETLVIDVRTPSSAGADLFAEPPTGWYIGQPALQSEAEGVSRFALALNGRPRDAAIHGQRFRFVAVAGGEAIEELIEIP